MKSWSTAVVISCFMIVAWCNGADDHRNKSDEVHYKNHRLSKNDTRPIAMHKYPVYPAQVYANLSNVREFTTAKPSAQASDKQPKPIADVPGSSGDVVRVFVTPASDRKRKQDLQQPTSTAVQQPTTVSPVPKTSSSSSSSSSASPSSTTSAVYLVTSKSVVNGDSSSNKSPVYSRPQQKQPQSDATVNSNKDTDFAVVDEDWSKRPRPRVNGTNKMRRISKTQNRTVTTAITQSSRTLLYATTMTTQSPPSPPPPPPPPSPSSPVVRREPITSFAVTTKVNSSTASKPFTTVLVPKQMLEGDLLPDSSFRPIAPPPSFTYKVQQNIDANSIASENRRVSDLQSPAQVKATSGSPKPTKHNGFAEKPVAYKVREHVGVDQASVVAATAAVSDANRGFIIGNNRQDGVYADRRETEKFKPDVVKFTPAKLEASKLDVQPKHQVPKYDAPRYGKPDSYDVVKHDVPKYEVPTRDIPKHDVQKYDVPSPYGKPEYDVSRHEVQKYDAPRYGKPEYDVVKHDVPKYEVPTRDIPKHDVQKYDVPRYGKPEYDVVKHDVHKYDIPKHDVQKYEIPKHDVQKYEIPQHDVQKYDVPRYGKPEYDVPKYDVHKYDIPKHDVQKYEIPKHDVVMYDTPKYGKPAEYDVPKHDMKYAISAPETFKYEQQSISKSIQSADKFREFYPATEIPTKDLKSYPSYNLAGKFDMRPSPIETVGPSFELEKQMSAFKEFSNPPSRFTPMNHETESHSPEFVLGDVNPKDVLKSLLRDMIKSKQQSEVKPKPSTTMDEIIDSYFKSSRPNVDFSLDNYDIETDMSCNLRSTKYISDGQCVTTKPVVEAVCADRCLVYASAQPFTGLRQRSSPMANQQVEALHCVDGDVKLKRVQLQCRDGNTVNNVIKVVINCKCKLHQIQPQMRSNSGSLQQQSVINPDIMHIGAGSF